MISDSYVSHLLLSGSGSNSRMDSIHYKVRKRRRKRIVDFPFPHSQLHRSYAPVSSPFKLSRFLDHFSSIYYTAGLRRLPAELVVAVCVGLWIVWKFIELRTNVCQPFSLSLLVYNFWTYFKHSQPILSFIPSICSLFAQIPPFPIHPNHSPSSLHFDNDSYWLDLNYRRKRNLWWNWRRHQMLANSNMKGE